MKKTFLNIIFFTFTLLAQQTELEFKKISLEEGLSQSVVLDIAQDSAGFLWIATQDGLNRYDGNEFVVYRNNPDDSSTLSDNWITTLCIADDSTIFVGTARGGTNRLNLNSLTFERNVYKTKRNGELRYVSKILKLQNRLFIGTWGDGLITINLENNRQKKYDVENSPITSNKIRELEILDTNSIAIGTVDGLFVFNINDNTILPLIKQKLTENFVLSILTDSNNNIWIGTRKGLNVYKARENKLIKYFANKKRGLEDDAILDIFEDKNGYVWLGTNKAGVCRTKLSIKEAKFDYANIIFNNFSHSHEKPNSISGNYVRKIFQDKSEVIWIGTWGAGISQIDAKPPKFYKVTPYNLRKGKLSSNLIRTFSAINGELWIGTADKGIDIFSFENKTFRNIQIPNEKMNNEILAMLPVQKVMYVGTYAGLNSIGNGESKFYKINKQIKNFPEIVSVYGIIKFKRNLLLGTTMGLVAFDFVNKTFYVPDCPEKNFVENYSINYLLKDSKEIIWAGTKYNFLLKMRATEENGKIKIVQAEKIENGNSKKFPGQNRVNYILEKSDGNLWLATSQGLIKFNPESKTLRAYTEKDGLANSIIYAALEDNQGNIWISTNNGLSKIRTNKNNLYIKNYTVKDGLQSNEFIQASCFKLGDTLYFGGINGYNYFLPSKVKENPYAPEVVLTKYIIANKPPIFPKNFNKKKEIVIRYSDKIVTFVFAALEFTEPSRNLYSYYLENFDTRPLVTTDNKITYTNLDPGEYFLRVKASNNDGIWNEKEYSVKLIVIPPFYLTWQFKVFAFALLATLVASLVRYRYKKLLETERLRTKIASDLHDDVGSMLTQISIYADLIGYEQTLDNAKKHGRFISGKSREIIGAMSDIIWSIDSRYDKMENLIDRMREFGINITQPQNIKFEFETEISNPDKNLSAEKRQNIFMIFKEALNNAVKYAETKKISVKLTYKSNKIKMVISDYGKGVDISKLKRVSGIRNMQMRAERIEGKIKFENKNGFTISLEVKI